MTVKLVEADPTVAEDGPDKVYEAACTVNVMPVGSVPSVGLAVVEMVPVPAADGVNVKVLAEDVPAHVKLVGENVPASAVDGVIVPV